MLLRKEIIMDEQAVEVIEPALIKNSCVSLNDMRPVKPVNLLFHTFTNKITFQDCRGVDKTLLICER